MKIYTRTGDDGATGVIGGGRISKSDPRIQCSGAVDELNACLGLAAVALHTHPQTQPIASQMYRTQRECFVVGAYLAAPDPANVRPLVTLNSALIDRLEQEMDAAESHLAPLQNFILPGGCEASARLHHARTVCRRAESLLVELRAAHPSVPELILIYLNRLSDWLFVHARLANHLAGIPDVPWHRDQKE